MQRLSFACVIALFTGIAANQANAQVSVGQLYGSVGVGTVSGSESLGDIDLGTFTIRGGARLHRHLGVEGELSLGVEDDSRAGLNTELTRQYGAYLVGYAPIIPNAELFARLGYGAQKFRVEDAAGTSKPLLESVNIGVGGQYFFDEWNGVRVDLTHQELVDSDAESDGLSISYVRKF